MTYLHLIYYSKGNPGLTQEDLSKILATSRRINLKNGVTGLLIYRDNYFFQLLEGTEAIVLETLSRIKNDSRHFSLTVIGEYKSNNLLLPSWSMAFVDSEKMANSTSSLIDLFDLARGKNIFTSGSTFELLIKKVSKDAELFFEK